MGAYKDAQAALVAIWNRSFPVGTQVRFFPERGDDRFEDTKTRSEAWLLGDHSAVVKIESRTGGVALTHCMVLEEGEGS